MELFLIRHAATTGQDPSAPLSAEGHAQAEALVPVLTALRPSALFSSPYTRAHQTLEPYAKAAGQEIRVLEDLHERLLSPTPLTDFKAHLKQSFADPDHAPEGGESHRVLLTRVLGALAICCREGGPRPVAVTHGGVTGALLNSIDASFGFEAWKTLQNPDLFAVAFDGDRPHAYRRIPMP